MSRIDQSKFRIQPSETWPNFFIVGAAKAGTTSLYAYLRQHPEIFMPEDVKEPHYFAEVRPSRAQRYASPVYISDRDAYLRLFRAGKHHRAIGEASPSYLWCEDAPARIHAVAPEARIIITLRDPVERAYSHYLMDYREGAQHLPFFDALQADWLSPEKGWAVSNLYVELGFYARQIERYLRLFGEDRVHILFHDDLRRLAQGDRQVLADILRFLDVDVGALAGIDTTRVENGFAAPRAEWARRIAGAHWARWIGNTFVPHRLGAFIFNRFFVKPSASPPMDPRARTWLTNLFEPEIRAVESLLGRPLPELRHAGATAPAAATVTAEGR
jgi:hypothetical protein